MDVEKSLFAAEKSFFDESRAQSLLFYVLVVAYFRSTPCISQGGWGNSSSNSGLIGGEGEDLTMRRSWQPCIER
jgi:hypothetical protein